MSPSAARPAADALLVQLARYARDTQINSAPAYDLARAGLMDALACAFQSLQQPACVLRLGPTVPGATFPGGARVPGTSYELEPVQAAFNIGLLLSGPAVDAFHPAHNLGAILAIADYRARQAILMGGTPPTVRDVLTAMIKAIDIQGALALDNDFDRRGLDPALLVRIASTACAATMLGGSEEQVVNALSNAFLDGAALNAGRFFPQDGSSKSRSIADACSRAVRHALRAVAGEPGCPAALTEKDWGFNDAVLKGDAIKIERELGSTMMEKIPLGDVMPLLQEKYAVSVAALYPSKQQPIVQALFTDPARLDALPVQAFMATLVRNG